MSLSRYQYHAPPTSSNVHRPTQNNGGIPRRCRCNRIDDFPTGFRFNPDDIELIVHYLKNRVKKQPFPFHETTSRKITEVDLYKCSPDELTAGRKLERGEKYWYFITGRHRKYKNGSRPNRTAGVGFWKATGSDKVVKFKGKLLGHKKTLKYYIGKNSKYGIATNWIMHEFSLPDESDKRSGDDMRDDMRLKGVVLCKIYKKLDKKKEAGDEADDQTAVYDNADPQMNNAEPQINGQSSGSASDPPANGGFPAITSASLVISDEDINSWNFPPVPQTNDVDFSIPDMINWDFLPDLQTNDLDFMAANSDFQNQQEVLMTDQVQAVPNWQNQNLGDLMAAAGSSDFQYQHEVVMTHRVQAVSNGQNQDSGDLMAAAGSSDFQNQHEVVMTHWVQAVPNEQNQDSGASPKNL